MAMEHLDEYLSNVPEFSKTAKGARGDYRAAKQDERVGEAQERGILNAGTSGSGANLDNAQRQRIKALYLNKKVPKTPEEEALMKEIATGGNVENIARLFSKLGPKHPLTGWGSAIAADVGGGSGLATLSLGVGAIAQHIAERGTAGKIGNLSETIRRNSPLYRSQAPQGPVAPRVSYAPPAGMVPLAAGAGSALAPDDALGPGQ
jgi:hypothetical protein